MYIRRDFCKWEVTTQCNDETFLIETSISEMEGEIAVIKKKY